MRASSTVAVLSAAAASLLALLAAPAAGVTVTSYSDAACGTEVGSAEYGSACIQMSDGSGQVLGSAQYTCDDSETTATYTAYDDGDCQTASTTTAAESFAAGDCIPDDGGVTSTRYTCTGARAAP